MQNKRSVVILGAGFGGIAAAKALAADSRAGNCQVTVIDRSPVHLFTPLLYEAATGFVEHENVGTSKLLRSGIVMDCADLLVRWQADFLVGEIDGLDWEKRQVILRNAEPVHFDDVIVALGAEVNFFGIPGLKENSLVLKTAHDADRLRQRVHDFLHMKESGKRETLNIIIGGGGATGVELASELTMLLRRHVVKGHLKPTDYHITLVEASSRILAAMPPAVSKTALERLKSLGVHVKLDSALKEAMPKSVTLIPRACKPGETVDQLLCDFKLEGSKSMPADIVLWCGGIRGSSSLERLNVPLDERGKRVPVEATLEITGREGGYAIGDSALLMDPRTKNPVPWLAQAAMVQGQVAGRRISAKINGTSAPQYSFPIYPVVVPLGGKHASAIAFGHSYTGFLGWLVHEAATLGYFMNVLSPIAAIRYWWNGVKMYAGND